MSKISLHLLKPCDYGLLICIGTEESIGRLKEFNHEYNINNVINFLIENNIYCYVSCEYEGQESSMILSNPDKSYDNLDAIEKTKEEVDNILKNSWWLYKFEIQNGFIIDLESFDLIVRRVSVKDALFICSIIY